MTWRDVTLLLQLHDTEYHVDHQTTTYHLLYVSLSANTSLERLNSYIWCQQRRTCWGSETASRQRRRHRSQNKCKLHHHGMIFRIVDNYIRHCVNTTLQWWRHDDSDNNRSGSSSSSSNSSSSSDDEYSTTVLLISLLGRPNEKNDAGEELSNLIASLLPRDSVYFRVVLSLVRNLYYWNK